MTKCRDCEREMTLVQVQAYLGAEFVTQRSPINASDMEIVCEYCLDESFTEGSAELCI